MEAWPTKCGNARMRRRNLARRLEILSAAGKEFRLRGFAETGMRDIARAADLSPANLYNYFTGKYQILYFCQDFSLDFMLASMNEVRHKRINSAAKLRRVIVSHLEYVLGEVEGSTAHLLTDALPQRLQIALLRKRDRYEEGLRQLVAAGIRSGEFVPYDPALATRAILGALNWSVRWFNPDGTLTAAQIAEEYADYLIRGLLAQPGAAQTRVAATKQPNVIRARPSQVVKRRAHDLKR
jgi:TetR/AcrR family transcriptional regulator